MKRRIFPAFVAVILLTFVGAFPSYAQQAGLTLEQLGRRVEVLFTGQNYIIERLAALETVVASQPKTVAISVTETPTPTTPPPLDTPTPEVTETATNTATPTGRPHAITARRQQLREGPGPKYPVVGTVETGREFAITGKNLNGDWWRIYYKGNPAWIPAAYVDAYNTEGVSVVSTPTPVPTFTPEATATVVTSPTPTAAIRAISTEEWDVARNLLKKDTEGAGLIFSDYSSEDIEHYTGVYAEILVKGERECGLTYEEVVSIIDVNGQMIEDADSTIGRDYFARWRLLDVLDFAVDEIDGIDCSNIVAERRKYEIEQLAQSED